MRIVVEASGAVRLEEPTVFNTFSLLSSIGDATAVLGALGDDGTSAAEHDHVFIGIDAVRRLAGEVVDSEWERDLATMVVFAGSNGWLDETGTAIKAHIELP